MSVLLICSFQSSNALVLHTPNEPALCAVMSIASPSVTIANLDVLQRRLEGGEDRRLLRQRPADESAALERAEQQQRHLLARQVRAQSAGRHALIEHAVQPVQMDLEEILHLRAHALRQGR